MTTIAMWSGPRNISTAMMYSFGNRSDCEAWDEPFYGAYLRETGLKHPMRSEILEACENDWRKVAARCAAAPAKSIMYQKHMTHHMLPQFDLGFIKGLQNAFLIRSPEKVLASYAQKHEEVSLHAIGFVEQAEIFDKVADYLGHAPPVIDSDDILANPKSMLTKLCAGCGVEFNDAMVHWPKGPKPFDGVWAPHWYNAAWASEGFAKPQVKDVSLAAPLKEIAEKAMPYYEKLKRHRIT